jgi:hypothetical protein
VRSYALDEASLSGPTAGTAFDTVRGAMSVPALADGAPVVIQAATPRARRFTSARLDSLVEAASDEELRNTLLEECTVACIIRRNSRTLPGVSTAIWSYSGPQNDASAATNFVRALRLSSAGLLRVFWEHSVGVNVGSNDFPGFTLEPFVWTLAHVRFRDVTGPGPGGSVTADLFVNGALVSTLPGLVNASNGETGVWRMGAELAAGGAATNAQGPIDLAGVNVYAEALSAFEIEEDARRFRRSAFFTRHDLAVVTTDVNGATRNLTDLDGVDFVDAVDVSDEIDQATMNAKVTLLREQEALSLAGLVTQSKLNLANVEVPSSFILSLLRETAPLEVFSARVPLGVSATPDELALGSVFSGEIDEIDDGGEAIVVDARDLGGRLIDTYIEQEVAYSDPVTPFAVEGEMQFLLNDNDNDAGNNSVVGLTLRTGSYVPIVLFTPTSPGWAVLGWRQRREPVLSALRSLAAQIGWECRYRYDPDPAQRAWRLTLYEPDRARIHADAVIDPDDILDVRNLKRSTFGRRTNVRVIYPSSETTLPVPPSPGAGYTVSSGWYSIDGDGNRMVAYVEVQSDTALAVTGKRQFMEVTEQAATQVDTVGEAFDMAFGSLRDLEDPGIQKSISLPLAWETELNDMLRFRPIRDLFTAAQTLAVRQVTHSWGEQATTSVQLRGKPSVGFKRWLRLEARPGNGNPGVLDPTAALTDEVTGSLLQVYRNILDRSSYLTGGKFVQVRNSDFASFSAGLRNPPDGWSMGAGVWTTDANVDVATNLSGGKAIRFLSTTAQLRSDFIPITGAVDTPYSIEVSWQRTAGDDLVQVDIEWFDVNKALISTQVLYPGGPVNGGINSDNFPVVSAAVGTWFRSRAEGCVPPAAGTGRFARLVVRGRQVGGGFNPIVVDDVGFFRASRKGKTGVVDLGTRPAWPLFRLPIPGGGAIASNVPFIDLAGRVVLATPDPYDVGRIFPLQVVPTVNGGYAQIADPGIWRFATKVWFTQIGFAATDFAAIEFVKNATYSLATGQRTGGTIIDSFRFRPLDFVQAGAICGFRAAVETRLVVGDRVSVDLRNFGSAAPKTLTVADGNALDPGNNDYSYLHGVHLLNE